MSSVSTNETEKFIPRSFRMFRKKRCKPLFTGVSASKRLLIPILGAVTTAWFTLVIRNISRLITRQTNLQLRIQISMASKVFGHMPNPACKSSMELGKVLYYLHLKECEYRFNHRNENLYRTLLTLMKKYPL